jgi:formylmethanofuran dehydrogenase subunit E
MARLFEARYDGRCTDCGEYFEAGDEIGYNEFDEIVCDRCFDGD